MNRMDWDGARRRDKAKGPDPEIEWHPKKPDRKVSFAQVYARYANAERNAGRKPKPPLEWIQYLKARSLGRR